MRKSGSRKNQQSLSVNQLKLQLEVSNSKLTSEIKKNQGLQKYCSIGKQTISNLKTKHAGLETKNTELQDQNTELQTKNTELQTKNTELQTKNTELQTKNTELQDQHTGLETKNTKLQDQNTELQTKHTELETKNTALQKQHTELLAKNGGLQEQRTELQKQRNKLLTKNDELQTKNVKLEETIERYSFYTNLLFASCAVAACATLYYNRSYAYTCMQHIANSDVKGIYNKCGTTIKAMVTNIAQFLSSCVERCCG